MDNQELKNLCLTLLHANTQEEVIGLLSKVGLWQNPACWRYYGDKDNNYQQIGAQQRFPDAALVEKLVNAVDAKLMGECLIKGIDPEGPDAPKNIREAVTRFFEDGMDGSNQNSGLISEWPDKKRNEVAKGINLVATGNKPDKGQPCYTISDDGEGQTPRRIPETILSLDKHNKIKIPFVQGQFNQGGSGALRFCGEIIQQLVISRRNPTLIKNKTLDSDDHWGFTIVRREDPAVGTKNSVYTYLAPVNSEKNPREGDVLSFYSEKMPIFSEGGKAYTRESKWGTLIKLYEYQNKFFDRSDILRSTGLKPRLELLLPRVPLPIRAHECRPYGGHGGSHENNINGLIVRLNDDRSENIEDEWDYDLDVEGEKLHVKIFVFKAGKESAYKKNEGIIITLNGQTQHSYTKDFFIRKKVKRSYLKNSLLVVVDCSLISTRAKELLFMNSRDRISGGVFSSKIEDELEDMLSKHPGLRALEEKRRREVAAKKIEDDRPLEEILEKIFKNSPTLANLFLKGIRASNPVKTTAVSDKEEEYLGKQYPTFFKFRGIHDGNEFIKSCPKNVKARILFETDAENNYFERKNDPGKYDFLKLNGDKSEPAKNFSGPNLYNGTASLNVKIPEDSVVGDELRYTLIVTDSSFIEPITNNLVIRVDPPVDKKEGYGNKRRKPPSDENGDNHEIVSGIKLPDIQEVPEAMWETQSPPFDKFSALRVCDTENGEYDFKVNIDNIYLKSELKTGKSVEFNLVKHRYIYGMVLIGLAMLQDDVMKRQKNNEDSDESQSNEQNIYDRIETTTRALSPILLPMINSLAELEISDNEDAVGEQS
jgi:hypothetical protein